MKLYAQKKFLWSGFWLLPYVEVVKAMGIHADIGLLWWYWEIHVSSPKLAQSRKGWRICPMPTILIQAGRSLVVKFFFGKWFYEWWIMSLED